MIARVERISGARKAVMLTAALMMTAPAVALPLEALAARGATGAGTRTAGKPPSFPIPASERLGNKTAGASKATTSTPATSVRPTTTTSSPASALPTPSASPTPNPSGATPATTAAKAATPAPSAAPRTLTPAGAPLTASSRRAHAGPSHLSTAALIVAIVAGLVALGSAMWVLVRWLAPEPRWARSLMYSIDEASFRASSTWSEFVDWAHLGR